MNRRRFLSVLAGAVASASFDPERALWVPGAKTISIPAPLVIGPEYPLTHVLTGPGMFPPGTIVTIRGVYSINPPGCVERFRVIDYDGGVMMLDPA